MVIRLLVWCCHFAPRRHGPFLWTAQLSQRCMWLPIRRHRSLWVILAHLQSVVKLLQILPFIAFLGMRQWENLYRSRVLSPSILSRVTHSWHYTSGNADRIYSHVRNSKINQIINACLILTSKSVISTMKWHPTTYPPSKLCYNMQTFDMTP